MAHREREKKRGDTPNKYTQNSHCRESIFGLVLAVAQEQKSKNNLPGFESNTSTVSGDGVDKGYHYTFPPVYNVFPISVFVEIREEPLNISATRTQAVRGQLNWVGP